MAEWDGRGLPPVAQARVDRSASSGLRTSFLSVPGAVGAEAAGFTPLGEIMGCIVERLVMIPWPAMAVNDQVKGYQEALRHGYEMALTRLMLEADAIGADGVIGVKVSVTGIGENLREFVALGTGVRANTRQRPGRPFSTDLSGQDVAKLMRAGWVPVSMAFGIGVLTRFSYTARAQTAAWAGNTEVDYLTDLVTRTRAMARKEFEQAIKRSGADGGIVSDMSLSTWPLGEAAVGQPAMAASVATIFGTAISKFHKGRSAPVSALTIMPVNRSTR